MLRATMPLSLLNTGKIQLWPAVFSDWIDTDAYGGVPCRPRNRILRQMPRVGPDAQPGELYEPTRRADDPVEMRNVQVDGAQVCRQELHRNNRAQRDTTGQAKAQVQDRRYSGTSAR
jgi:hypothetical protein